MKHKKELSNLILIGLSLVLGACGSSDDESDEARIRARAEAAAQALCAAEFSANCDYNILYDSEEDCLRYKQHTIEKYPLCNEALAVFYECMVKEGTAYCRPGDSSDPRTWTDFDFGDRCKYAQQKSFDCFDENYPDQ